MVQTPVRSATFVLLSVTLGATAATAQIQHGGVGAAPAFRAAPVPHVAAPPISVPRIAAPQISVPRIAPHLPAAPSSAPQAMPVPRAPQQQFAHPPAAPNTGAFVRHAPVPQIMVMPPEERRAEQRRILGNSGPPDRLSRQAIANPAVPARALHNPFFPGTPGARMAAHAAFHGRFFDHFFDHGRHHHRHHPIVIGWAGPLFWPYAYDDVVDYTFYPHAYDTFWPYAYDDIYAGMFGPYVFSTGAYASVGQPGSARGSGRPATMADVCTGRTAGLTDWPIARIAQAIEPDDAQRAALDAFKDAAASALEKLKAACPTALPNTPTGRVAAVHQRLQAMLQAVHAVRGPLEAFYQSLNDEQKARFNALNDDSDAQPAQHDLSQACGERTSGIANVPIDQLEAAVRPNETQRAALDDLRDAVSHATDLLNADCPTSRALTPVVRLQAMEQRLDAMLRAVETVEPALDKFYGGLSDEQKERFNRLAPRQS